MRELTKFNFTKNRWVVCLTAACFFFYEFFQINMFNALNVHLMRDLHVDGETLSWISSAYFYGVILLLLPAGIILDRFSPRVIILTTMMASIVGTGLFSIAQTFEQASLGRFMVGVTAGPFALLAVLKVASRWFKHSEMAFTVGLIVSIGMLAGIVAQAPFSYLVNSLGWRSALEVDVVIGLVLFCIMFALIADSPEGKVIRKPKDHKTLVNKQQFWQGLKKTLTTPVNWAYGAFAALTNLPIFLLGALWGGLYLIQAQGFSPAEASYITTMLYLGMLVGSPFFGWLSDKMQKRKIPMMLGGVLCLLAILIVMHLEQRDLTAFLAWFLVMGFGSSAHVLAYPSIAEANPSDRMGQSEGLAATLIMGAGAVFQPLLGILIKAHWNGTMVDQIPLYAAENYYFGLTLLPVSILVGILCLGLAKETYQPINLKAKHGQTADALS